MVGKNKKVKERREYIIKTMRLVLICSVIIYIRKKTSERGKGLRTERLSDQSRQEREMTCRL
jgi:hypothetical protein